MNTETKKALDRLDAAIGRLETAPQHASSPTAAADSGAPDAGVQAEIKAIRAIIDEAIGLLDPDAANSKGAEG